jgi:hypothetical protein
MEKTCRELKITLITVDILGSFMMVVSSVLERFKVYHCNIDTDRHEHETETSWIGPDFARALNEAILLKLSVN